MDPLTYSLCQKPLIGILMFATSICAFPPLFQDEPFALQQAGALTSKEFEAPVGKPYSLNLHFRFPSAAASLADEVVGSRHDESCGRPYESISPAQRAGLGRPIPVHVLVREKETGKVALDQVFDTLCITSRGGPGFGKTRTAARFELARGKYILDVRSLEDQSGLDGVETTVSLVPGDRK